LAAHSMAFSSLASSESRSEMAAKCGSSPVVNAKLMVQSGPRVGFGYGRV
jgi:hypothetical protein